MEIKINYFLNDVLIVLILKKINFFQNNDDLLKKKNFY
jgi:hypothetical protein